MILLGSLVQRKGFVCLDKEAVDGSLQRDEGMEHAAIQAALDVEGDTRAHRAD